MKCLSKHCCDDRAQSAEIATLPSALAKGPRQLRLAFSAKINPFGRGIFFADYLPV
jgi:hypothetical protein